MRDFIRTLSDKINSASYAVALTLLVILSTVLIIQIVTRYVLNSSLSWTEEIARYCFIWLHMLAAGICVKKKMHPSVSFLVNMTPARVQAVLAVTVNLLLILAASILLLQGLKIAMLTMEQPSPAVQVPLGLVYLAVPVGAFTMICHVLADMFVGGNAAKQP
ncbi:putative TRAP transporter small permease protein HI_1030 [uncultured delta proteobacterium]|uniref:Putative TRAP transporter small permease protein HI_1030 n=1 Tax=uncultured delta proteobacterium TaxID=34034 RepID=A0A212JCU6_9DELT|nr:putative TRAP transporter small permease protein HI_1030 [uncultured delta proteobacterium]